MNMLYEENLIDIFSEDEKSNYIHNNEVNIENEEEFKDEKLYFLPNLKKDSEINNNEINKKTTEISTKPTNMKSNFQNQNLNVDNDFYSKLESKIEEKNENKKKIKDETLLKKKRGRPNPNTSGEHNKFSDDNVRRKCKHILIKNLIDFINFKIEEKYHNNIGKGIFIKKLLTMNQKQKSDATVIFNQQFIHKTLKDIFSEEISKRYTIFPPEHNKNIINGLINEQNEDIRVYFTKLFNLTFIECLRYFRGDENILELKGLNKIESLNKEFGQEKEYCELLIYYLNNYENITNNKRMRIRTKKDQKNDQNIINVS